MSINSYLKAFGLFGGLLSLNLLSSACSKKYPEYIRPVDDRTVEVQFGQYTSDEFFDRDVIQRTQLGRSAASLRKDNKGRPYFNNSAGLTLASNVRGLFTKNVKRYSNSLEGLITNVSVSSLEQDYVLLGTKDYSAKINPSDDVPEAFAFPFKDPQNNNKISLFFVYDAAWRKNIQEHKKEIEIIGRFIVPEEKIGSGLYREVIAIENPGISGLTIYSGSEFIRLQKKDLDSLWDKN